MMYVRSSSPIWSNASSAPGTVSTPSALKSSTSSSVTSKALRNGGRRRSVSPAL